MKKTEITSCIWHQRAERTFEINTLDTLFITAGSAKKAESCLKQEVFCQLFTCPELCAKTLLQATESAILKKDEDKLTP